jgi:metallo-beta-lactamase family protein
MQLTCHGAVRTTTGSRHLLEINGKKILLDCGLYEGKREEAYNRNKSFPFPPDTIDAVILSHAHIDHSGNLPNLVQQGFTGNIYCTFATRDLCSLMLQDSAKVQASDIAFVNKRRAKKSQPLFKPLYDSATVDKTMRQFVAIDYHRPFPVCDGVTVSFIDAGHMLGSAQVLLDLHAGGKKRRFLFSGDVGRSNNDILRDPEIAENVDFLLVESTYGGCEHETMSSATEELCRIIRETHARKGKVIIPSFAVGRVQQVVYALHQLRHQNCFPPLLIYVDSPLAVNSTEVFRLHPECYNHNTLEFLRTVANPFGWDEITYVREASHSMKLNDLAGPAIIISSSGMCEAGRILHHLRNNISNPDNTILFVGYCAEHTLGGKLQRGGSPVNIFGEPFDVKAHVVKIDAFSGHADHSELMDYVGKITGPKRQMVIVHGEEARGMALQKSLHEAYPKTAVVLPEPAQVIPIV